LEKSSRHLAALALVTSGCPIVVLGPGQKTPAFSGPLREITDAGEIDEIWGRADHNIGVRPANLGLVALDVDIAKGVDANELNALPPTYRHLTPSGGWHLFYKAAQTYGNHKFARNIDVRSKGGYVVWPPSVVNGVEYRADTKPLLALPDNIAARLDSRRDEAQRVQTPDTGEDAMPDEADVYCAELVARDHHPGRYALACALTRNFGLSDLTATTLCEKHGLRTHPASSGIPWLKVCAHARKYGQSGVGEGPARVDPDSLTSANLAALGPPGAAKGAWRAARPSEQANRPAISYHDSTKLLPTSPCFGFFYGKQGSHKTGLITKLGLDIVEAGGRVLYLCQEGEYGFTTARLPRALEVRGLSWDTIDERWVTETRAFSLLNAADVTGLCQAYADFAPSAVFIDVLAKVAPGDINSPEVAVKVLRALQDICDAFQCPLGVSAHPGKDTDRGILGSSLFEALADFVHNVYVSAHRVLVHIDKMKDGEAQRTERFDIVADGVPYLINTDAPARDLSQDLQLASDLAAVSFDPHLAGVRTYLDQMPAVCAAMDCKDLSTELLQHRTLAQLFQGVKSTLARKLSDYAHSGQLNGYAHQNLRAGPTSSWTFHNPAGWERLGVTLRSTSLSPETRAIIERKRQHQRRGVARPVKRQLQQKGPPERA
jgi:hypothetical protein